MKMMDKVRYAVLSCTAIGLCLDAFGCGLCLDAFGCVVLRVEYYLCSGKSGEPQNQ